jgi:hypothetical protein
VTYPYHYSREDVEGNNISKVSLVQMESTTNNNILF